MTQNFAALLGTKGGPAIRPGSSMPTSLLFCLEGQHIVVDCGLGVTRGLVDQGVQLKDISVIFITHLHSDHYLELGPLIHTAWTAGLSTAVEIWGPAGMKSYWDNFVLSMQADIDLRIDDEGRPDIRDLVRVHVLDAGDVAEIGPVVVRAIRTIHPPLIDSFALSFQSTDRHIVFSGDTAPLPALEEFARGADLLIHEAMLDEALPALMARVGNGSEKLLAHMKRSHTTAQEAARTATAAGVKRLAIAHLIPADDPAYGQEDWLRAVEDYWSGPLFIGEDGLRIDL